MQVANALNNTIRILFNPKIEPFKLFDFLIVKSSDERYLAQIVEIYEDKFDSSQNVAKLKLFYKISSNNEVMPYDNFTPNKECEIIKVKSDEVEDFINNDKKTFIFATDVKTSQALNIQYDFFNKNAVILADKVENSNSVSLNLAKKLSEEKNVILIDFTGIVEFEEANKVKACKGFKMPLNYNTLDYVFDKCLADASLEFQAIGIEILNAIKKFAKKQENGFIPFNAFVNVIMQQYKATPYPELQLLLARMRKYQMYDIFARNKKEYEALSKTINNNKITILDLSGLDTSWQKAYLEYIVSELEDEVYLISRINDENFDHELATRIYNEKKNITFIPNVSYNYSKLPSIMQYCKNYVLLPSLYQRNDFLDANFALSNLISDECILFGENTDNFLYLAKDYELEIQEKRKNYRKIALTMAGGDEILKAKEDKQTDSQRLIKELSTLQENSLKQFEQEQEEAQSVQESHDEFQEIKQEIPQEVQTIKNLQEVKLTNEPEEEPVYNIQEEPVQEIYSEDQASDDFSVKEENVTENVVQIEKENDDIGVDKENIEPKEEAVEDTPEEVEVESGETEEIIQSQPQETFEDVMKAEDEALADDSKVEIEEKQDIKLEDRENQELEISDEELDFFELANSSQENIQQETVVIDDVEYKSTSDNLENNIIDIAEDENDKKEEDLDLSEVASNAIENNFNDIINAKKQEEKPTFEIDENTKIQVDVNKENEGNLPIFKEEENLSAPKQEYEVGGTVIHAKYGRGTIVKIIQYDQRQLLQIDFDSSGKKLLDPKIAEIQLEQ